MWSPRRPARSETLLSNLVQAFLANRGVAVEDDAELLKRADAEGLQAVTEQVLGTRSELTLGHFRANARRLTFLRELSRRLGEVGARVLIIKGGALLFTVYDGRISLRPLSDVDLVVPAECEAEVLMSLRGLGYLGGDRGPWVAKSDGQMVDLHNDILGSSRVSRRRAAFRFDTKELWARAVPVEADSSVYRMSLEDELLLGAVHVLKHSYSRLIWLLDLALLAREVDRSRLLELAERTGTQRPLAYASFLVRELFGVELPAVPVRLNWLERRFLAAAVARRQFLLGGELLVVFSLERWWDRVLYLFELAFPADEMDRTASIPVRVGRRLWHLARLGWRELFGRWGDSGAGS